MIDNGSGVVFTSKRSSRQSTHTPEEQARRIPSLTNPAKTLLVARPVEGITETDTPERSALVSQLDYRQSELELSARPILDINQDGNTEMDTDQSERSALATHVDFGLLHLESLSRLMVNVALNRHPMEGITAPLPVESMGLALAPDSGHVEYSPSSRPLEHSVLDMEMRHVNLDSSDEPQFGSDLRQSSLELEVAIRCEVLKSQSIGRVSARDVNGLLLSPENACLGDMEMSLDEVRSEGLRQWNMDMDVEYQYETFNGLPVYYGGDMIRRIRRSMILSRWRALRMWRIIVPEGMELMIYTRRRPDGSETRVVNMVDMVPMCRTVSCVMRIEPHESSDTSGMDTAEIEESDIEDFCLWPDLWDEGDCSGSNVGSSVDNSLCRSEQDNLSYVDVESMGDFDSEDSDDAIGFNSDEGSVAELEWNTWDDACAWEFQNTPGVFPPDSAVAHPAGILKDSVYCIEDSGFPEWDVCCTGHDIYRYRHRYVDGAIYLARLCLLERPGPRDIRERNDENVNVWRLEHRHTICWHTGVTDSRPLTVCYDCLCLISLLRTMMSLSYDWDGALDWIGHDEGYDCSPAGELGYLPRCLYSPLVMDRMT